ncbi:MAG: DUF3846 domain-containing protein [Deltaproteobacteria bacterium]|nr:DUF3846 domain-containing protein [Kofleriaceae bacterium]
MNKPANVPLRCLLFPVDGLVEPLEIDPTDVLRGLYRAMRCSFVDVVALDVGIDLWCDDEALLKRPVQANRAWLLRRCTEAHAQPLFGNVVALGSTDGISRSLTVDEADLVLSRIIGVNIDIAAMGDRRPPREALERWLVDGVDWRN